MPCSSTFCQAACFIGSVSFAKGGGKEGEKKRTEEPPHGKGGLFSKTPPDGVGVALPTSLPAMGSGGRFASANAVSMISSAVLPS